MTININTTTSIRLQNKAATVIRIAEEVSKIPNPVLKIFLFDLADTLKDLATDLDEQPVEAVVEETSNDDRLNDAWQYVSTPCPGTHKTILMWLSDNYPDYLDSLDDPIRDTCALGRYMTDICNKVGGKIIQVPSPSCVHTAYPGIEVVNAYPNYVFPPYLPYV